MAWAASSGSDWPSRYKWWFLSGYSLFMLSLSILTWHQLNTASEEANRANAAYLDKVRELKRSADDLQNAQLSNNKLQQSIVALASENTRLIVRMHDDVTGGTTLAYVSPYPVSNERWTPIVTILGPSPLQNINVRVFDGNHPEISKLPRIGLSTLSTTFVVPFLKAPFVWGDPQLALPRYRPDRFDLNFFINTPHSSWTQESHARRVNERFEMANRIRVSGQKEYRLQCWTANFPIDELLDANTWNRKFNCDSHGQPLSPK